MSGFNKGAGIDPRLLNLTNSLYITNTDDVAIRTGITGNINISGPVTIPGTVTVNSSPENPVHVHVIEIPEVEIKNNLNSPIPISKNTTINSDSNPISTNVTNFPLTYAITDNNGSITVDNNGTFKVQSEQSGNWTVAIDSASLSSLETITVTQGSAGASAWKVDIGTNGTVTIQDGGNSITVDGTVNIGTMPEVEIKNDLNNPIPISKNTSANSDSNPLYVKGTSDTSFFAPTQSDAFGRLRVSNPFTLFESFHRFQDNGRINEYTSGTASSSYDSNSSTVVMTVGTTLGDKIYRESDRVFAYQPGKSLLVLQTFCMNPGKAGLRQRQGYFDTQSGIYVELNGTTLNFVRRNSVSGSLQEYRVPQDQWNVDTMSVSGNNPSGAILDITRVQIFWMDIEWLGVGSVRMGFVVDGQFVHCHTFHHANRPSVLPHSDTTLPYMQTACLPVRAELENISATASSSSYRLICTSVISEGGYTLAGRPQCVGHALATPRNISSGTLYPLYSMRLKTTRLQSIVIPFAFSVAVSGNTNFKWYIIEGGTTSNGSWESASTTSSIEYNLTASSIANGTILDSGYIINSNQASPAPSNANTPFQYQLKRNTFTSTASEFTLCIETTGSNLSVWASVTWQEVT